MSIILGSNSGENLTSELTEQTALIEEIRTALVGKATIANATADKILEGYSAYVGRELVEGKLRLTEETVDLMFEKLPYGFIQGSAVVFNNEIHILGSNGGNNGINHYKWDGTTWTEVSTLPYDFKNGSAVVLNGEIHILGGVSYGYTTHYKWNGTTWTSVSTLPYDFYNGSAVVLNGKIHILGGEKNGNNHVSLNSKIYRKEILND